MEEQLTVKRNPRGQSLVEFALTLPVLLLVFMGILDFGRLLMTYAQASNQVRTALRYGVVLGYQDSAIPNYLNCAEMLDITESVFFADVNDSNVTIEYLKPEWFSTNNAVFRRECTRTTDPATLTNFPQNGDILRISVDAPVELITPFLAQTLSVQVSGQRTLVRDIELPRLGGVPGGGTVTPDPLCSSLPSESSEPFHDAQDGDGLDDRWECAWFGHWDNATPGGNPDGDLCDNLCEYEGSTDPLDSNDPTDAPAAPSRHSDEDAYLCSVYKSARYMGLEWPQFTPPDGVTIDGYHIYATPINGPRVLVGNITDPDNIPADPSQLAECGYAQVADAVTGKQGCFNALADASAFWNTYGTRLIDYSVSAYSNSVGTDGFGESRRSGVTPIACQFKVNDLTLVPDDGTGTGPTACASAASDSDSYIGLSWTPHPDAVAYRVYAQKLDNDVLDPNNYVAEITIPPASGTDPMMCGYAVTGPTDVGGNTIYGCFQTNPNATWKPKWDYSSFIVLPKSADGVLGGFDEAINGGFINPPGSCR